MSDTNPSPTTTPAPADKKNVGGNPLKPFMAEIMQKVIGPKIHEAINEAQATLLAHNQENPNDQYELTQARICQAFNILFYPNPSEYVSTNTFARWMKECGYSLRRTTIIAAPTPPAAAPAPAPAE